MPSGEGIFSCGRLDLPQVPPEMTDMVQTWGTLLPNRILVVLSVVILLFLLTESLHFFPTAMYCVLRARGSINLEHSLSQAKSRNILAIAHIIPFCLVVDWLGLIRPVPVSPSWSALCTVGVLIVFAIVRFISFKLAAGRKRVRPETSLAARRAIFTFFTVLCWALMASVLVMLCLGTGFETIRNVAKWEIIGFYALSFLRTGQILSGDCTGISTILYLCALEIIPAVLLVASVLYLTGQ